MEGPPRSGFLLAPGSSSLRVPPRGTEEEEEEKEGASEACCELCGLYFENRKALASHARAHLRQFGVTEWCVNGSPIETLSEWIRHRPHKAGAYRTYIQGGRPFAKKFRNAARDADASPGGSCPIPPNRTLKPSPLSAPSEFERRQARPLDTSLRRDADAADLQRKLEEPRQAPPPLPPRVRPVPSLVPRPPQTSLVKFVGNIYTLKCRFCEVEFQGPLSIQEEWVRHLQRHILDMNFAKADPLRAEPPAPEAPAVAEAQ
ncbi:protein Wiz-like [Apteryx rowi]|uniref:protein Wiz-like n=1 Tax=Apteryx rowi TaxID=308060 RepID=UPI000E1D25EE|nr:protein Wiz-like [Apteryx rowi]